MRQALQHFLLLPLCFVVASSACNGNVTGDSDQSDDTEGKPAGSKPNVAPGSPTEATAPNSNGSAGVVPKGIEGILDCPTVAYPGTEETAAGLSPAYGNLCAACHGGAGEGQAGYPALPSQKSKADFIKYVRAGGKAMPAFDVGQLDDATLAKDFEALSKRTAGGQINLSTPAWAWTPEQIKAKRAAGIIAWRKADSQGAACASCHSPDAIDLAVIGYPDSSILRRAHGHISTQDALAVVDYVHAQRRTFNITRPCSPDWRVFQPGGEVLPGSTPKEQDSAFSQELVRRGLLVATGKVTTIEDADKAWNELATLNLRRLRIGIALPRWTQDGFNGDGHKSINDWISSVPRMAKGNEWYQQVDAYLADPTIEKMTALLSKVETLTDDGGFSKKPWVGGELAPVFTSKFHVTQVASHYFRMALLGKPGWFEQAESPPELTITRGETYNPFNAIGFAYQENHCYNQATCSPGQYEALPASAKLEFDPIIGARAGGTDGPLKFVDVMQDELTHPWWTLAALFDPSFGAGRGIVMHYWLENPSPTKGQNFPQRSFHRPFLMAVTMVKRAAALEKRNAAPGVSGHLHGNIMSGFENTIASTMGDSPENIRLTSNLMRMTLLRQQRSLKAGAAVANPQEFLAGTGMGDWATGLDSAAKEGKFDAGLLTQTATLARDVLGLIRGAKVVTAP